MAAIINPLECYLNLSPDNISKKLILRFKKK